MRLQLTTRHFDISPELKSFTEERVRKLKRYFDQIIDVTVILSAEKYRQAAEITLRTNGHNWAGTHESTDMKLSIDGAVERIETQLRKHKEKIRERKGRTNLGEAMADGQAGPQGVEIEDED